MIVFLGHSVYSRGKPTQFCSIHAGGLQRALIGSAAVTVVGKESIDEAERSIN